MVVEARVAAVGPRDHPDVDVLVAPELLERAVRRSMAHQRAPLLRVGGDPRDQLAQLARVRGRAPVMRRTAARSRSRAGLRLRRAPRTASPSGSSARRADGPVGAVDEPIDADLAEHRVDGPGAVGRDVEEHVRIADGDAAAGHEPLAMQRRQAGEHGEAHAQPRVRGAAPDREGVPRRLHLGHVVRQRRPPARHVRSWRSPAGPGWTSSGALAALERLEHGAEAIEARGAAERAGRDAGAGEPPVEQSRERRRDRARRGRPRPRRRTRRAARRRRRGRPRAAARPRRPGAPRCRAGRMAPPARVRGRRRRRAPRGARDRGRRGRRRLGLAARRSTQPVAAAHEHRRLAAARQLTQQRLGPQVLVDVGRGRHMVNRFSEPLHQYPPGRSRVSTRR